MITQVDQNLLKAFNKNVLEKKNMTAFFFFLLCKTIHTFGSSFSHFGIAMFVSNSDFVAVKSELHSFDLILYKSLESGTVDRVFLSSGFLQLIQRYLGELLAASRLARCAMFKLQ